MRSFKSFFGRRCYLRLLWNGWLCFETQPSSEGTRFSSARRMPSSMSIACFASTRILNSKSPPCVLGLWLNTFLLSGELLLSPIGCMLDAPRTLEQASSLTGRYVKFEVRARKDDLQAAAQTATDLQTDPGDTSNQRHHTFALCTRKEAVSVWAIWVFIRITKVRMSWRTRELCIFKSLNGTVSCAIRGSSVIIVC